MKVPVVPFLLSLLLLLGTFFVMLMEPHMWWLFGIMLVNFVYSTNREIWHNGRPLVLWHRK